MDPSNKAPKVKTCLWFDGTGEEAARFYVSLLPDSSLNVVSKPDPDAPALIIEFTLASVPYQILNGGPTYTLTPATSISVLTDDQAETDRLWAALVTDGGAEGMCGWLVDRFGLSWQIVPRGLLAYLGAEDREAAGRAHAAMMQMSKIDLPALDAAFNAG
ncbi:VOC family protein [Chachezhania antarctica]|uniref:VOC family protein n=1 Tax=Chachezhania antarctica TaxID=2340860 RepID=UPI000EAE4177|nr:VOC family protein [Chachezhania antarctica]